MSDDLDRRLTQYGQRWRAEQPPPPQPPASYPRRVPDWAAPAATAAAVVAVITGIAVTVGAGHGGSPTRTVTTPPASGISLTGAVPWVDLPPRTMTPTAAATSPAAPRPARRCTASDLHLSMPRAGNGAGGHLLREVVFTNTSRTTCTLRGYPQRVVASEPGQPDVVATNGSWFPDNPPGNATPGGTLLLGLETDSECPAHPGGGGDNTPYHSLTITLNGSSLPVSTSAGLYVGCGLKLTRFSIPPPPTQQPTQTPDPLNELRANLEMPATAHTGSTLVFVADVTNPTGHDIDLRTCMGYIVTGPGTKAAHAFNPSVSTIPAQHTIRFAIHVDLPTNLTGRQQSLTWMLLGSGLTVTATGHFQPR